MDWCTTQWHHITQLIFLSVSRKHKQQQTGASSAFSQIKYLLIFSSSNSLLPTSRQEVALTNSIATFGFLPIRCGARWLYRGHRVLQKHTQKMQILWHSLFSAYIHWTSGTWCIYFPLNWPRLITSANTSLSSATARPVEMWSVLCEASDMCMLYVGSGILHEKSNQFNVLPIQTARKYNHPSCHHYSSPPLLIPIIVISDAPLVWASLHRPTAQEALPSVSTIRVKHENAVNCGRVQQKLDLSHTYVEIPPVHGKLLIHSFLFILKNQTASVWLSVRVFQTR